MLKHNATLKLRIDNPATGGTTQLFDIGTHTKF